MLELLEIPGYVLPFFLLAPTQKSQYLEKSACNLNNWVVGWVDWNIALTLKDDPNWAKMTTVQLLLMLRCMVF